MGTVTTESSVVINRPIQDVFDTATCMESCINWWTIIKEAKKVTPGPTQIGTEYVHTGKFMGISVQTHPVVSAIEAPHHFAYRSSTAGADMDVSFDFAEVDGGTKMTIKMVAQPLGNRVSQALLPVLVNAAQRQFSNDMQGLKALMENDVKVRIWQVTA